MSPADERRIAEAATSGPWEYVDWHIGVRQVPTDQHLVGPNKYEMDGIVPGEHIRPEDAEFIATFNPARVLELLEENVKLRVQAEIAEHDRKLAWRDMDKTRARLAAVEKLHHIGYAADTQVCNECYTVWPCPTIKAIRGE